MTRWLRVLILGLFGFVVAGCGGGGDALPEIDEKESEVKQEEINKQMEEEMMKQGKSPQEACEAICERIVEINGGKDKVDFNDKFVAINKDGELGCASIRGSKDRKPELSYISSDSFKVYQGTYLMEV